MPEAAATQAAEENKKNLYAKFHVEDQVHVEEKTSGSLSRLARLI